MAKSLAENISIGASLLQHRAVYAQSFHAPTKFISQVIHTSHSLNFQTIDLLIYHKQQSGQVEYNKKKENKKRKEKKRQKHCKERK